MEKEKISDVQGSDKMVKPNYMLMSLQRIFLLVTVAVAIVVIVYFTPMPEEYFENCDRECHELDWPMICRVKLVVEVYKTLSKSCGSCTEKEGGTCPPMCISGDGRERGVLSVNRELPAPPLHVCQNDILVVDVVHRAPAHALALHWRGQPQKETPFMDGAPMLTQCPQPAYTTFQYKFRASAPGTHMYHAHSAADAADGLAGAFVVRQSPRQDPLATLYDEDLSEHTLFIAEWGHSMGPLAGMVSQVLHAESLLINGKGKTQGSPDSPLSKFYVRKGKRFRFRVAYGGGSRSCPITFSIDEHMLKLVALDGNAIEAEDVESIKISKGERFDFILNATRKIDVYSIRVVADEQCQDGLHGQAELVYNNEDDKDLVKVTNELDDTMPNRKFSSVYDKTCDEEEVLCIDEVHSIDQLPEDFPAKVDTTFYVPFNYSTRRVSAKRSESWGQTDGHRFTYPESPLLTQGSDVTAGAICTEPAVADECVHVKSVALQSVVEIVMFDQGGESDHIFHLHGYRFYVIGIREFNSSSDKGVITKMHQEGSLFPSANHVDPVLKDTITVPKFGVVALRFRADNPGYWLMRDERSNHWTRGLDFILKVGEETDFVPAPADFPRCGSYVGPEYFLI